MDQHACSGERARPLAPRGMSARTDAFVDDVGGWHACEQNGMEEAGSVGVARAADIAECVQATERSGLPAADSAQAWSG
jgi:hypothetical protein